MPVRRAVPALLFLALSCSLRAADAPEPGKTWTLAIGISKYQNLPKDLWLQYPEVDAKTFAKFIASPRGGGAPQEQIRVLTDEQATTAAIRHAFDTFLSGVGKNDTVYVLIAGHGTVDNTGAYVLTYDSDPGNLAGTALPMANFITFGGRRSYSRGPRHPARRRLPCRCYRGAKDRRAGQSPGKSRRNFG